MWRALLLNLFIAYGLGALGILIIYITYKHDKKQHEKE